MYLCITIIIISSSISISINISIIVILYLTMLSAQLLCSASRAEEQPVHLALRKPAGPGLPGHGRARHHLQQRRGPVEEDARLLRQR